MTVKDVVEFFGKASGVFYRYYFAPTRLVTINTTFKEVSSFTLVIIGFFFSLPFLEFSKVHTSFGDLPITEQSQLKYAAEFLWLLDILFVGVVVGGIQFGISRLRGMRVPAKLFIFSAFYCFSIFLFAPLVLFYCFVGLLGERLGARGTVALQTVSFLIAFHMIFVNIISAADRKSVAIFWIGWFIITVFSVWHYQIQPRLNPIPSDFVTNEYHEIAREYYITS
jgi:hypothetical protein